MTTSVTPAGLHDESQLPHALSHRGSAGRSHPTLIGWWRATRPPTLVVVQIGGDGTISLYNAFGSTDVVIDVVGYYS